MVSCFHKHTNSSPILFVLIIGSFYLVLKEVYNKELHEKTERFSIPQTQNYVLTSRQI